MYTLACLPFVCAILFHRDIDKVDDLMAEITEQQEVAQEISDVISRPVGFGEDYDEVRKISSNQVTELKSDQYLIK